MDQIHLAQKSVSCYECSNELSGSMKDGILRLSEWLLATQGKLFTLESVNLAIALKPPMYVIKYQVFFIKLGQFSV